MHRDFPERIEILRDKYRRCLFFSITFLPFLPVSVQFLTNASVRRDGRKTSFAACCDASPSCVERCTDRSATPTPLRAVRGERADPFASHDVTELTGKQQPSPSPIAMPSEGGPATRQRLGACFSQHHPPPRRIARGSFPSRARGGQSNNRNFTPRLHRDRRARLGVKGAWRTSRMTEVRARRTAERWSRTVTNVHTERARAHARAYVCIRTCTRGFMHMHMHMHEREGISAKRSCGY